MNINSELPKNTGCLLASPWPMDHQILYQPCHLLKMAPNIFWHLCLTQPIHWLQIERNIYACALQESCVARDDSVWPTLSTTVCFHVFKKPSVGFSASISDLVPLYYVCRVLSSFSISPNGKRRLIATLFILRFHLNHLYIFYARPCLCILLAGRYEVLWHCYTWERAIHSVYRASPSWTAVKFCKYSLPSWFWGSHIGTDILVLNHCLFF